MSNHKLINVLIKFSNTAQRKAKIHSYYAPTINVHPDQSYESVINELNKIELFFRNPELSYLNSKKDK